MSEDAALAVSGAQALAALETEDPRLLSGIPVERRLLARTVAEFADLLLPPDRAIELGRERTADLLRLASGEDEQETADEVRDASSIGANPASGESVVEEEEEGEEDGRDAAAGRAAGPETDALQQAGERMRQAGEDGFDRTVGQILIDSAEGADADAFIARAQEAGAQGGDQSRIKVGEKAELTPEAYSYLLAALRVDPELAGFDSEFHNSVMASKNLNAAQKGTILKVARGPKDFRGVTQPQIRAFFEPTIKILDQTRADRRRKVDSFGAAIVGGRVGGRPPAASSGVRGGAKQPGREQALQGRSQFGDLKVDRPIKSFQVGANDGKGRKIFQPTNDPNKLLTMARTQEPVLARRLQSLAGQIPGAEIDGVRLKDMSQAGFQRMQAKLDEGQNPEMIGDYLAGRLFARSPGDVSKIIAGLKERFGIVKVDDFLERPRGPSRYRAVHVQVKMPNGLSAEVQIQPRTFKNFLSEAHASYRRIRPAVERTENERRRVTTEAATIARKYDNAYKRWMNTK